MKNSIVIFIKDRFQGKLKRIPYLLNILKVALIFLAAIFLLSQIGKNLSIDKTSLLDTLLAIIITPILFLFLFSYDVKRMKDILGNRPNSEAYFLVSFFWVFNIAFPLLRILTSLILFFTPSSIENSVFYKRYFEYSVESFSELLKNTLEKVGILSK